MNLNQDPTAYLDQDVLAHLSDMLGVAVSEFGMPRRGTPEYRHIVEFGTKVTEPSDIMNGLGFLWAAYGWPAIVDFQNILILHMNEVAPTYFRDSEGRVQLKQIIKLNRDETDTFQEAVNVANEPNSQKYAEQNDLNFSDIVNMGMRVHAAVNLSTPLYQEALNAAWEEDTHGVRAALTRVPRLKDPEYRDMTVQCTFIMALANLSATHPGSVMNMLD